MGKIIIIVSILVLFFGTIGIGLADKGNPQKGKMLFAKNCRSCHIKDGKAKPLYTSRLKQADWQAAFAKEKYMAYPCKETLAKAVRPGYSGSSVLLHGGSSRRRYAPGLRMICVPTGFNSRSTGIF